MTNEKSLPSSQREFERGFGWTLLLSAAGHLAILVALIVAPGYALRPQAQLKSYSVDIVDPSKLGGTNLVAGSKGKSAEPPKVEPAKAKAPEPPPPPPEPPKAEPPPPPEEAKAPEPPPPPPKQEVKPPEPPKEDEKAIALAKKAEATPTRPQEVAKVEAPTAAPIPPTLKPEPTVAKVEPTKPKATVAKIAPTATQAKAAAKPQTTPTKASAQAVAKAQTSPGAKANTTPGAKPNTTPAKATTPGKGASPAAGKATPSDGKGDSEKARDDRIAAAIKRVQEQAGTRGGGSGGGSGDGPGGPISMGPGEGAGGEVRSLATIMYTNRITAMIKDKWVWAGAKNLKADIAFRILPTGDVADVRTASSSGDARYDRLAETAVRAASPFPAPPAECAEEFETSGFLYTFEPE